MFIGNLIPEGDEHWQNYLQLMTIVFVPSTNEGYIAYLRMLIEDFLTDFHELYPKRQLTPKMHYILYIPTWMQRYHQCNLLYHKVSPIIGVDHSLECGACSTNLSTVRLKICTSCA